MNNCPTCSYCNCVAALESENEKLKVRLALAEAVCEAVATRLHQESGPLHYLSLATIDRLRERQANRKGK
jgi:hypothetical protein